MCGAGVELASNCRGVASERGMAFMLLTAATSLGLRSVSHGFLAGAFCWDLQQVNAAQQGVLVVVLHMCRGAGLPVASTGRQSAVLLH